MVKCLHCLYTATASWFKACNLLGFAVRISLIIGAIKVLCWVNNVIDLPVHDVCTFLGMYSELATEIPGLK